MNKKAILALLVAGIMIVSVPMVAMADTHKHNGGGENADVNASGSAVAVEASGDVNCNVLNVTAGDAIAIQATSGATVTATRAENNSNSSATVDAKSASIVEVNGDVKNDGNYCAIYANQGSSVKADSAENNGSSIQTVNADGAGTNVTVTNDVTNNSTGKAIWAENGATVTVGGDATTGGSTSVYINNASGSETTVTVFGDIKGDIGICINDISKDNYDVNVYKIDATSLKIVNQIGDDVSNNQTVISNIHYIIKNASTQGSFTIAKGTNGTVGEVTDLAGNKYQTATAANDYKVTVATIDGYTFKQFAGDSASLLTANGDGTYTLIVPTGGGVSLELVYEAIKKQSQSSGGGSSSSWSSVPTTYGSASAPITGGRWSKNADGSFTYYNNGEQPLNNRVWIKYNGTDGKEYTGCFYFDKQGKMQTGWKQIDGEWYYFDETEGNTKGMMQVNTTTPDGYKVDANGKWVK